MNLSIETSLKLQEQGFSLSSKEIYEAILPVTSEILKNKNITKDPTLMKTLGDNIRGYLNRIASIDTYTLSVYQKKKWYLDDLRYNDTLQGASDSEKDTIALRELLQNGIKIALKPQVDLFDRAFQKRALKYDYKNFAQLQGWLLKIDNFLPGGESILDFVLDRNGKWLNLANDPKLREDGMNYIVDLLNPLEKPWLKQMIKNGSINPSARIKWRTDAVVNGKTIDTVALLCAYQSMTGGFQSKEWELTAIRDIAKWKFEWHTLPATSKNFKELTPSPLDSVEALIKFAEKTENFDDLIKVAVRAAVEFVGVDYFLSGITGVNEHGLKLTLNERGYEMLSGWAKLALMNLFGKCFMKLITGTWHVWKAWLQKLFEVAKTFFGDKHAYTKRLARAI